MTEGPTIQKTIIVVSQSPSFYAAGASAEEITEQAQAIADLLMSVQGDDIEAYPANTDEPAPQVFPLAPALLHAHDHRDAAAIGVLMKTAGFLGLIGPAEHDPSTPQ